MEDKDERVTPQEMGALGVGVLVTIASSVLTSLVSPIHYPVIRTFSEYLRKRGKEKKLALIACMRKLLVFISVMDRNSEAWRCYLPHLPGDWI